MNPTTVTDAVTSGSIVTTANGDYIFGVTWNTDLQCVAGTTGTNFTSRSATACATIQGWSESQVQSAAGSIAATFTNVSSGADFITAIQAFKEAPVTVLQQGGRGGRSF